MNTNTLKDTPDNPPLSQGKLSYFEKLCRDFFSEMLFEFQPIYNARPDFLKNPRTGKNLELDIWYKKIRLAVEANGILHQELYSQKQKDRLKKILCKKKHIKLIILNRPKDLFLDHVLISIKECSKLSFSELVERRDFAISKLGSAIESYRPRKIASIQSLLKIIQQNKHAKRLKMNTPNVKNMLMKKYKEKKALHNDKATEKKTAAALRESRIKLWSD